MNNQLKNQKRDRVSHSHRHLLGIVWKIHQGIRNGAENEILREYLQHVWNTELRDHFLHEEIFISSNIKHNHPVIDTFFQYHVLFRKKIKQALDPKKEDLKNTLENLCILLIEMVRYEERRLKPYLCQFVSEEMIAAYHENDDGEHQVFSPKFWSY